MASVMALGPDGRIQRWHAYDLEQLDQARARYESLPRAGLSPHSENAATRTIDRYQQAWAARDPEAAAATLAPGFRQIDHRTLMHLDLDRDEFLAFSRETFGISVHQLDSEILALRGDRLALARLKFSGEGASIGPTEIESLAVIEADQQGRRSAMVRFDPDSLDAAYAELERRFAALAPDPLRIPPNSAWRVSDSIQQASDARDWDGLAALCSPDFVWDDRRRRSLVTGGRDTFVASVRVMAAHGSRVQRTLLATAGDRLCLLRLHRTGATADIGGYESESLALNELDAEGRVTAIVGFDPDDRRAASLEMFERWARSAEARAIPAATFEAIRAMNAHDVERLRAVLPSDFVMHDHRRTGLGRIEGGDAFADSLAAAFELAGDWTVETLYVIANESHGELAMARAFGTLAGGGEFEAVYLRVIAYPGRMELFEPDDLEHARARFAELREPHPR